MSVEQLQNDIELEAQAQDPLAIAAAAIAAVIGAGCPARALLHPGCEGSVRVAGLLLSEGVITDDFHTKLVEDHEARIKEDIEAKIVRQEKLDKIRKALMNIS